MRRDTIKLEDFDVLFRFWKTKRIKRLLNSNYTPQLRSKPFFVVSSLNRQDSEHVLSEMDKFFKGKDDVDDSKSVLDDDEDGS